MLKKYASIFIICAALTPSMPVHSQGKKDPNQFYEKGFAADPLEAGKDSKSIRLLKPDSSQQQYPTVFKLDSGVSSPIPTISNQPLKSGSKISAIGLIIDGADKKDLLDKLAALDTLATSHKFRVGSIAVVNAPYPFEPNKTVQNLVVTHKARFIGIDKISEMPDPYRVTRSPSWVIQIPEGQIVLEGLDSPNRFVGSNGELIGIEELPIEATPNN